MVDDDFAEHTRIFHSFPHEITVFHIAAVIGKSYNSFSRHPAHSGQFFTFKAFGQRADNVYFNDSFPHDFIFQAVDDDRAVNNGLCVRHRRYACKTAGRGRPRTAGNRFFLRLAGLPQMHMHIDKTGCNNEPFRINDRCPGGNQFRTDRLDFIIFRKDIAYGILSRRRIDQSSPLNE